MWQMDFLFKNYIWVCMSKRIMSFNHKYHWPGFQLLPCCCLMQVLLACFITTSYGSFESCLLTLLE